MCGSPPDGCTPKAFVDFLGFNQESPFKFDVNITDTPYDAYSNLTNKTIHITPINTTMSLCSKGVDLPFFKAAACGCSDCVDMCPKPVPPPVVKQCKIWGLNCWDAACIAGFIICSIGFCLTLLFTRIFKHLKEPEEDEGLISNRKIFKSHIFHFYLIMIEKIFSF